MKKLVFLVLFVGTFTFANNSNPANAVKNELRTQIVKLLGKANFVIENNIETVVEFMVNKNGEIIVLTVNSDSNSVKQYIKQKLNYNTVVTTPNVRGKVFKMPLKLVRK